jgi:hypothetical protein
MVAPGTYLRLKKQNNAWRAEESGLSPVITHTQEHIRRTGWILAWALGLSAKVRLQNRPPCVYGFQFHSDSLLDLT